MSPEQAAGEREIDGRSDVYSLGVVSYPDAHRRAAVHGADSRGHPDEADHRARPRRPRPRPDVPEDLALAVSRCLEKDPENRWPSADALRRSLESRTVGGYRPTGTSFKGQRFDAPAEAGRLTGGRSAPSAGAGGVGDARPALGPAARSRCRAATAGPAVETIAIEDKDDLPVPDTGEPRIVQKVRGQFASWAAVSLGCLGINIATGITDPWFLFPMFGMGIGVMRNYAQLWQAGYSWRDVLTRPPAPDAVETTLVKGTPRLGRQLPPPRPRSTARTWLPSSRSRATGRRFSSCSTSCRRPSARCCRKSNRPSTGSTSGRPTSRARCTRWTAASTPRGCRRSRSASPRCARAGRCRAGPPAQPAAAAAADDPRHPGPARQVASHLESCVLAMQNVRFDLLRLRSAGVAAVLGDLTQATQQAKALSRDVDNAIAAAGEIREAMPKPTNHGATNQSSPVVFVGSARPLAFRLQMPRSPRSPAPGRPPVAGSRPRARARRPRRCRSSHPAHRCVEP